MKTTVVVLAVLCSPALAAAQSDRGLSTASAVFGAAAAADWASTHYALRAGLHEANPLLAPCHDQPTATVVAGAALDAAWLWAVHRYVAPRHPKAAMIILYAAAAGRACIAARNVRVTRGLPGVGPLSGAG